jgi:hypothetical protein
MNWQKHPFIYEINTWTWLNDLSRNKRRPLDLGSVPDKEWDALAKLGMDAIWLMGVWERSPAGIAIAVQNEGLQEDFRRALPDVKSEDIVGSPYCIRRYIVDERLGGKEGLAKARQALSERNIQLVLDFVPNHVAPDHPSATSNPDYFVRGDQDDLRRDPDSFAEIGGQIFARGRDPYFPAWPDVLQLNAFSKGLRKAAIDTLKQIASQSDGVRCDMAMLFLNEIFARTWGKRVGEKPADDYWKMVIQEVRREFPQFTFIAEAYWDMEAQLQQQGFDFCYDKRLYDRLCHESAESVRSHLRADLAYQERLVRFIENHDEPRAAAEFSMEKEQAAATLTMTLAGAKLMHEGQLEGRKVRLPVFLSRRPDEPVNQTLQDFYLKLLKIVNRDLFRNGNWALCECEGWPDNNSAQNLIAYCWSDENEHSIIVVNLSGGSAQARVKVPWEDLAESTCRLTDLWSNAEYERDGNETRAQGLYVDLKPWASHCFRAEIISHREKKAVEPMKKVRSRATNIKQRSQTTKTKAHRSNTVKRTG